MNEEKQGRCLFFWHKWTKWELSKEFLARQIRHCRKCGRIQTRWLLT